MATKDIRYHLHEKSGISAWSILQLLAWPEINGVSFLSVVDGTNTCTNTLSIESEKSEELDKFEASFRKDIEAYDSAGDPGERTTRQIPMVSETVEMRIHLRDDDRARYNLLLAALQCARWKPRMRQFEIQRDAHRRAEGSRYVLIRMQLIASDEDDRGRIAGLASYIHAMICERNPGNSLALYMHKDDKMVSGFTEFTVEDVLEWLSHSIEDVEPAPVAELASTKGLTGGGTPDHESFVARVYVYRSKPYKLGEWDFPD